MIVLTTTTVVSSHGLFSLSSLTAEGTETERKNAHLHLVAEESEPGRGWGQEASW